MAEEKTEKEFVIRDRRSSSETNERPSESSTDKEGQSADSSSSAKTERDSLPDLDFATFILSLATTAQMSLGMMPNPQSRETAQNLPAAKQMIDIIGMLKEKTRGNLNAEEQELLESMLFNLRMMYVRTAEGKDRKDKKQSP